MKRRQKIKAAAVGAILALVVSPMMAAPATLTVDLLALTGESRGWWADIKAKIIVTTCVIGSYLDDGGNICTATVDAMLAPETITDDVGPYGRTHLIDDSEPTTFGLIDGPDTTDK